MLRYFLLCICVFIICVVPGHSEKGPCTATSKIDEPCNFDDDCAGTAVVCRLSGSVKKCTCHENYYKDTSDGVKCVKAPDQIGDACPLPSRACKPPLTCDQGKCKCLNAKTVGKSCVLEATHGASCAADADCALPFTTCQNRKCLCIGGLAPTKAGRCTLPQQCPDGSRSSGQKCTLKGSTADPDIVLNTANTGGTFDEGCKAGDYCVTDGHSKQGFCCKASCPLNYEPSGTCDNDQSCPNTHYCHRIVGPGFSYSVCCIKPCRDPTPIYSNGTCHAVSASGEDCKTSAECYGGITMQCVSGKCRCKTGYRESRDGISSRLVCIKECSSTQASVGSTCFTKSAIGAKCVMDWQCPEHAQCFAGKCACSCNYKAAGNSCQEDQDAGILGGLGKPGKVGDGGKPAGGGIFDKILGGFLGGNGGGLLGGGSG